MCGIVGYVGTGSAKEMLLAGLSALEYRGYDSAGIALVRKGKLLVRKESGKLRALEAKVTGSDFDSRLGIGHTRWATHGAPTRENAHPHVSGDGRVAIVHNGIIENFMELKEELILEHGVAFASETDSEVIAHLVSLYYEGDLVEAVRRAAKRMRGAYAACVVAADDPGKIVAIRKDAPLIAGMCEEGGLLASDIPALLKYTRDIYLIENNEIVVITKQDVEIYDEERTRMNRARTHIDWDVAAAEKGGYEHFMLKEIYEQPKGVRETLAHRLDESGAIQLDDLGFTKEWADKLERIYIVACGTACHAGMVGKAMIEKYAKIPCETCLSSEFRYSDPIVNERTLCICISQSGETSDTLEALREAKRRGAEALSIVNVVGSSVARASDHVFYTWAGPEIAVASTKAYTTQLVSLYLIALYLGLLRGRATEAEAGALLAQLAEVPALIEDVLGREDSIRALARQHYKKEKIFYAGRGTDVATAEEASLKLKEISYINSYSIAAGELKHGTIALITRDVLFFALATQTKLYDKMLSNIEEMKARQAQVVAVAKASDARVAEVADDTFFIPDCSDEVAPIVAIVMFQLFAYHVAKFRGREIDQPRNLAKSVTVE
ncbi:MAG: glutamine--fructose-6-phosphate transaminase (isomerizing) [Clostridiales Family XIII bacterium]|jgi:glucosamine--fructose-6-phosphate aminotransferase (isomerizing)|nr:glutamine--fructose-6-phosphate transaminase (isomerizing) [Clostridiales Family XIII bacterium]